MSNDRTVILNGTKVWLAAIGFLVIHGSAGVWWASSIHTRVAQLEEKVSDVKQDIKEEMKEIKQMLKKEIK